MAKKTKLLIATDSYLPRWDGIVRFLLETVPGLSKKFDVTIVAPAFGKRVRIGVGVKLIRFPTRKIRIGDYPIPTSDKKRITELVTEADVIFTQTIGPIGRDAINEAHRQKKPVAAFIHSIEWELVPKSVSKFKKTLRYVTKQYAKRLYRKCSALFVPSEDTAKMLRFAHIKSRQHIVYLGCNTKRFSPTDKQKAKKAIGLSTNSMVIGFCGRIAREKDLPTLHKAFHHLVRGHPNLRLLIVGSGLNLKKVFSSMDKVVWIKSTDKPQKYLNAMDIFVMPSLTETSSLATMEAMSCSLPVVATFVGHIKHYISDGKNGYFFPRGDWGFLTGKLDVLIKDKKIRERFGRAARKTIVQRYTWTTTINSIVSLLGTLKK